jgi:hypothetical protein
VCVCVQEKGAGEKMGERWRKLVTFHVFFALVEDERIAA